jgi:hypothetical protein
MVVGIMAEMERPDEFVKTYVGYTVPFQLVTYIATVMGAYSVLLPQPGRGASA